MTHRNNPDLLNTVLQLLTTQGKSGPAVGLRIMQKEATCQEGSSALPAQPYERSDDRLGHANGFKPKSLATHLLLAVFEMNVRSGSTRKASKIAEELCGYQVSSTHVSACAAKIDVELKLRREPPLNAFSCQCIPHYRQKN